MYNVAMSKFSDLKIISHHAYYLTGGEEVAKELKSVLEKSHRVRITGNPDFYDRRYETFTIDDARQVKAAADSKPTITDGKKFFVLQMSGITVEAQNAMLKLLEEPAEYTHFFLIIPSVHLFLPTMKSRMSFVGDNLKSQGERGALAGNYNKDVIITAKSILAAPAPKRLDIVKSFMDEITKEKRPKQDAIDLLAAIEEVMHEKTGGTHDGLKKNLVALEAVTTARKYSTDRAPSLKMLLEYVAMCA